MPPAPPAGGVSLHVARNRGRYGKGALAVGAGAILAKPIGRVMGGRSVNSKDPHYDMNYRSGRSQFHQRRRGFQEAGARVIVPALASATGGGIVIRRAKSGYGEGKFKARQAGTQKGYEDEYRRYYGRRKESEDLDEILAPVLRGIGGTVGKAARAIGSGARGVKSATSGIQRPQLPKMGLKTKIGLGAAGLAGAYGAYKGSKEVYKKVSESEDPFTEDDLIEVSPISFHSTARRLGPTFKWSTRGLAAADVGMLSHQVVKDKKNKNTPLHPRKMDEAVPSRAAKVLTKVSSATPNIDRALLSSAIGGSFYYKARDYKDKQLLKKTTHGVIDRSKEK